MKVKEVIEIAIRAGEILLVSGAEVYRVEDTIRRISSSYNVDCECFVMPTGIFISNNGSGEEFVSYVKRIKERSMDLHRIELINAFSRDIESKSLSYEAAMEELAKIEKGPYFNFPIRLMSAGMTAFVYTLLFRGTIYDAMVAFFISLCIYTLGERETNVEGFQFFYLLLSGIIAGGISIIMKKVFPILNTDKIIIGAIMILVPGVAITNGIKDALHGDIVSSFSRIGEAIFVVTAVGIGVAIMLLLVTRWV